MKIIHCVFIQSQRRFFFWLQSLHQPYEEVLAGYVFSFLSHVNYATFVSNDKVNERIFQRELASLSSFFQRLDKLEQFGKRPQACRMIVSHANNHLLTLSEFASDKANYHLKMSSKTLWAKSLHHDSQLYYRGYVTTRTYTQMLTNIAQTHSSPQPLNWLQGYHMNALI